MKNKNLKESKGITLIALVITIIVLLILAAVSIATLTGENGILTKAQTAKKETEEGQEEEQVRLAQAEANMNNEETEYAGITIPAGMAPTRAEGENTVDEGLVAVDKNGNEWVWVEVPKNIYENIQYNEETPPSGETDYTNIEKVLKAYAYPYTKGSESQGSKEQNYKWTDEWYEGCGLEPEEYNEKYHAMLKSVYKNEGFWIGRYEAGIEGTTGTDQESLSKARTADGGPIDSAKAICQKDAIPYCYATVSQAEELASEISPNSNKTSSLLFGIQWDLVCKFLEVNSDLEIADIYSNSEKWGNYSSTHLGNLSSNAKGRTEEIWSPITTKLSYEENNNKSTLLSTGSSEQTKKLNIYDFAGNFWEITLEHMNMNGYPTIYRGCPGDSAQNPASVRAFAGGGPLASSFRITLY